MEFLNFEGLAYFKEKENSQFAPVESTTTASQAYEIGQYFWYEGKLYEATAAIAQGDGFVTSGTGANCELADISNDFSDVKGKVEILEEQVADLEENKANKDGYYSEMTVGNAEQIVSTVGVEDKTPYNFRTAGGSVDIGDREEDMVVGGTVAWNQLVTTDTNVSKTKSGDIVTVNDAVAGNAEDLVVSFEPQQDLNGQDAPYPAGGGVNKFGGVYNVRFTFLTPIPSGTTITVSTANGSDNTRVNFGNDSDSRFYNGGINTLNSELNRKYRVITLAQEAKSVYFDVFDAGDYQIEIGDTPTTYKPYSNICPITGWTGCEVTRAGKNLYPYTTIPAYNYAWYSGSKALADATNPVFLKGGKKYAVSADQSVAATTAAIVRAWRADGTILENEPNVLNLKDPISGTRANYQASPKYYQLSTPNYAKPFTNTIEPTEDLWVDMRCSGDNRVGNDPMLQIGDSRTDYEPYNGTTYPVSWQSEAGTVYGGTLDVVSGVLTVNKIYRHLKDFIWSSNNAGGIGYEYYSSTSVTGKKKGATNIISDQFKTVSAYSNVAQYTIRGFANADYIAINFPAELVPSSAKVTQWLTEHDAVACYELAEPITYQLTPQQIALLAGTNNVWNSIGSTQMTYLGTLNEITAQSGHKYLTRVNGSSTVVNGSGQTLSGEKARDNIFDLTQMFGSSIADYVYSLENTSAGDGVTWFTDLFPKPYYSYNAGQLMSVNTSAHKTVGFNAFDYSSGSAKVVGGMEYQITGAYTALSLNGETITPDASGYFIPDNTGVLTVTGGNSTTTCIHIVWDGERNGEYEEYEEHTYALDESLTLRGIPKLDSGNKLYYDGDTYEDDGTVTRRYGIVDLGTLTWVYQTGTANRMAAIQQSYIKPCANSAKANVLCDTYQAARFDDHIDKSVSITSDSTIIVHDSLYTNPELFKAAMSGVYLVYELATPTTESADPYTNPQIVSDWGTEEYVDYSVLSNEREVSIPVGHVTVYQNNLRAKLEMAPESPSDGDGDYIVRQTNGENEYVKLIIPNELPEVPTEAGTYILQVTISSGTATYSWVSE